MSKAVMISIRPKWCEKICRGEKTIEVRKTCPKMETPFRVYIYRTKGTVPHIINDKWVQMEVGGTVIGEFVCDRIDRLVRVGFDGSGEPAKYCVCNSEMFVWPMDGICEDACLTKEELEKYLGGYEGYGWHISDLKIYDTPKDLSKFSRPFENCIDKVCDEFGCASCENGGHIKHPPQSWCYVENMEG